MRALAEIAATAACMPDGSLAAGEAFLRERAVLSVELVRELGVGAVRVAEGRAGSELALAACRAALAQAGVRGAEVDVLIDYGVLPQEYLVPAWSMGNKLQHELGATRAFTVGFSGAGATSFLVALQCATSLIATDDALHHALLFGAETALAGNRVINPDAPTLLLGDGASAVLVRRATGGDQILGVELRSNGALHDVMYVPGGAMAHPTRVDLYRLRLDRARYEAAGRFDQLRGVCDALLERCGVRREAIGCAVLPNISAGERGRMLAALSLECEAPGAANLARFGHVLSSDLALNYAARGPRAAGDHILLCSHGMGFMAGAALVRVGAPREAA